MSDAITNQNGVDLFASFREPAWHRKGIVSNAEYLSVDGFMSDLLPALHGRRVVLAPVSATLEDGSTIALTRDVEDEDGNVTTIPTNYASLSLWPDGSVSQYGVVGARYGVVQDPDAFSVFDGFRVETVGALYDGRKTFATFALERETILDPSGVADVVKVYGLAVNSHDGTSPLTWQTTPTRVVCANTLAVAMGNRQHVKKVRHTRSAADRVSEHAALYRASMEYMDEFDRIAADLFAAPFTDKQFANLFTTLFPEPEQDVKGALTKWENKRSLYMQAWNGAPNAGIRGTAWGAWNALTEANQWGRNERAGDRGADAFTAAGMGLDGPTNKFRQDTLALVMSRANVK